MLLANLASSRTHTEFEDPPIGLNQTGPGGHYLPWSLKMATSTGDSILIPKYILGTDWSGSVADQVISATDYPVNQLARYFPFYGIAASNTVVVPRVDTMSTAGFLNNTTGTTDSSVPSLVDPAEEITVRSIVGDVTLTEFSQDVDSFSIDQLKLQIDLKKMAVEVAFWNQVFAPQAGQGFEGLPDLCDANQVLATGANGGPFDLGMMDLVGSIVLEANAEMDRKVWVMRSESFVKFAGLKRNAGQAMEFVIIDGMRYAAHNGIPILICDYIPNDETLGSGTDLTSMYCMTLGYNHNGVFGVYPPGVGEDGWVIEKAQTEDTQDASIYRVKWYTTLVLGQITGLARIEGIDNS